MSDIGDKERIDYAWKHFALIADQRMKTFNFYIILLGVAFTGTVAALTKSDIHRHTFCLIGTAHILISLVFALIDWRGCRILKIASDALVEIEESGAFAGHPKLVLQDRQENKRGWRKMVSYRWAFMSAFFAQLLFGAILASAPTLFWHQSPPTTPASQTQEIQTPKVVPQ